MEGAGGAYAGWAHLLPFVLAGGGGCFGFVLPVVGVAFGDFVGQSGLLLFLLFEFLHETLPLVHEGKALSGFFFDGFGLFLGLLLCFEGW